MSEKIYPRLITRADDAGSFSSANRAILDSCRHGICRNVSIMAPCSAVDHAADLLSNCPDICLGMHATITCEWSHPRFGSCADAANVPALLDEDGAFVCRPEVIQSRGTPCEQIFIELEAQLEKLHRLGLKIDYLDTHMVWDWLHPPGQEDDRIGVHLHEWASKKGLLYWKQWGNDIERFKEIQASDGVSGFVESLKAMPDEVTQLIIKHPAYPDPELAEVTQTGNPHLEVGLVRDLQRRCFMDTSVREAVDERGIELLRYDEVQ